MPTARVEEKNPPGFLCVNLTKIWRNERMKE